jgi:hypothetical protein
MPGKTKAEVTEAAARAKAAPAYALRGDVKIGELLERARQAFYIDPNVIGVGVGPRRVGGETHHDEIALIVYVKEKLPKEDLALVVPREFEGIGTDVVAPFGPDAPVEALGFSESHQNSDDMSSVDWARLHEQRTAEAGGDLPFHGVIRDYGDVGMIQDDGTLVQTINGQQVVDYVRAYKLFRLKHPDIYDFVTFFTDTASGMPPQGGSSWYRFVFNDTQGIGFPSNFNQRAAYGTNKLQGILFLNQGHFPIWRYVMLQEQGHRWGSFVPYRDTATGPDKTDHMLGGWGHWAAELDDDRSPMDYDIHDWVARDGQYERVSLASDQREYSTLDLYLMGALGPDEVGDVYLLSGLTNVGGNLFTATKKLLRVENFVWANGARVPGAAASQKQLKNASVLLTKDFDRSHDLADRVDTLRRRFEADFRAATQGLMDVDTTIGPLRRQLSAAEVTDLTDGGYTTLHRHTVSAADLAVTGTQFTGTLQPGEMQNWFTHSWPATVLLSWSVQPTTSGGKLTWSEGIERAANGTLTYWLTIRNTGSAATGFEARYAQLR